MRPLRLDNLEIFEDVVRCGGFRAAALNRGVSSSAISQSISLLEEALGIRLLIQDDPERRADRSG